ncbi:MAG: COX15/CtaA family protein [Pseudomarimonas sp.]
MTSPHPHFHRIAWFAVGLALCVILFGAFVRLSNAGLSCPDWPTCYGKATWPTATADVAAANVAFPERLVESHKTWREQFHRHIAALLGLLVLSLALLAARLRRAGLRNVLAATALVAASIPAYIGTYFILAFGLAGSGLALLLAVALRWDNRNFARISVIALAVIIMQAMLGMWTVTWLLKPIVVMAHLLGGLTTLSLLLWIAWRSTPNQRLISSETPPLRRQLWTALALLGVQIALGGWVSANYAALACGTDFPTCLGQWWPATDFSEGFVLWRGIGVDYEGGVLDSAARSAIHLVHRLFAMVVVAYLSWLAFRLLKTPGLATWAWLLVTALIAQVALGISNVVFGLPLWVATLHTAGAALLLAIIVSLLARLRSADQASI